MRTDDVWFKPGDKVMRVRIEPVTSGLNYDGPPIKLNTVYCVEDFWEGPSFNVVMLVGCGGWHTHPTNGSKVGWRASHFRKVEEIAICIRATQREPVQL